jgi:hypothetical protein
MPVGLLDGSRAVGDFGITWRTFYIGRLLTARCIEGIASSATAAWTAQRAGRAVVATIPYDGAVGGDVDGYGVVLVVRASKGCHALAPWSAGPRIAAVYEGLLSEGLPHGRGRWIRVLPVVKRQLQRESAEQM